MPSWDTNVAIAQYMTYILTTAAASKVGYFMVMMRREPLRMRDVDLLPIADYTPEQVGN